MKHRSSRELYAFWNERRGSQTAPERGDVDPGGIRRALGDSFVLAFDPIGGHPFRLAGTRLCGMMGRELRHEAFDLLWQAGDRPRLRELIAIVADEAVGVVAGARGYTREGYGIELELLLLPLRHRGNPRAREIGTLAPLVMPYWLGSSPVERLELGMYRHVSAETDDSDILGSFVLQNGRLHRGLIVYDGGRSDP